jgi:hypothetical protein
MADDLAYRAARQRAFVFVEKLWSPQAQNLLGSKEEAIEYFTRESLRLEEIERRALGATEVDGGTHG